MLFDPASGGIFGGGTGQIESKLKDPNLYREAVIYEKLSHMSRTEIREFVNSVEARTMVNEGIISADILDKLNGECGDGGQCKATVCHMAKTNGDPLWDELVEARNKEKAVMDAMLNKYSEAAQPFAENAVSDVINKYLPSKYR